MDTGMVAPIDVEALSNSCLGINSKRRSIVLHGRHCPLTFKAPVMAAVTKSYQILEMRCMLYGSNPSNIWSSAE
jgi:hypothetical protein